MATAAMEARQDTAPSESGQGMTLSEASRDAASAPPTSSAATDGTTARMHAEQAESLSGPDSSATPHKSTAPTSIHPDAAEILRQVEYYFSDDNLPHDAHLLGLAGRDPNAPIQLSEILSFRKMRHFKPASAVCEVLRRHSQLVELSSDGKHVRRKTELTVPITVVPKVNKEKSKTAVLDEQKPWLTKAFLKPTGFEPGATDGPIAPKEWEEDRRAYDPEEAIAIRLENAANRFCARRKMHQLTRNVFEKFMIFGGMRGGGQFTGAGDKKTLKKQGLDDEEIERLTAYYSVAEMVIDGMDEDVEGGPTWVVDFEALAKAFLSSQLMCEFEWTDEEQMKTVTNVLRNFYNYLLLHDVCPEYAKEITAARAVCDLAEVELAKLAKIDRCMPGDFNVACSTLHKGVFADLHADRSSGAGWAQSGYNIGLDRKDATLIFRAGIAAWGTEEQFNQASDAVTRGQNLCVISEESIGLEVVRTEMPTKDAREVYELPYLQDTVIKPMGRLHCVRWDVPLASPEDLPAEILSKRAGEGREFSFLIEEAILALCYPGMKMKAMVKELDIGMMWIDAVEFLYPSYYTWLPNERIREWKKPGPPKGWMNRQNGVEDGKVVEDVGEAEKEADLEEDVD